MQISSVFQSYRALFHQSKILNELGRVYSARMYSEWIVSPNYRSWELNIAPRKRIWRLLVSLPRILISVPPTGSPKNVHLAVSPKRHPLGPSSTIMGRNAPLVPGYHHILQLLNLKLARRASAESFGVAARLPFNVIPGRNRNTSPTSARSQLAISVIKNENKIASLGTGTCLSLPPRPLPS